MKVPFRAKKTKSLAIVLDIQYLCTKWATVRHRLSIIRRQISIIAVTRSRETIIKPKVSDIDGYGLKGQKHLAQGKQSGTLGIAC